MGLLSMQQIVSTHTFRDDIDYVTHAHAQLVRVLGLVVVQRLRSKLKEKSIIESHIRAFLIQMDTCFFFLFTLA